MRLHRKLPRPLPAPGLSGFPTVVTASLPISRLPSSTPCRLSSLDNRATLEKGGSASDLDDANLLCPQSHHLRTVGNVVDGDTLRIEVPAPMPEHALGLADEESQLRGRIFSCLGEAARARVVRHL